MLIVSQDKTQVTKLNREIYILENTEECISTFDVYIDANCMGNYISKEIAQKVVEEITETYQNTQFYKWCRQENKSYIHETAETDLFIYQMPKE